jgi:hypothetical protein
MDFTPQVNDLVKKVTANWNEESRLQSNFYFRQTFILVGTYWAPGLYCGVYTRAVCEVRGLTFLLGDGTLWRCGDGLFFEVPPLASDALLTTLRPLFENVLQTVNHFQISCLGAPFSWLKKPRNRMGRDLN